MKTEIVGREIILDGDPTKRFFHVRKDDRIGGQSVFSITGDGKILMGLKTKELGGAGGITSPVVAASAFSHTAPGADDFAFANTINASAWGFSTQNEANSMLKALKNALQRIEDLENALKNAGIIA